MLRFIACAVVALAASIRIAAAEPVTYEFDKAHANLTFSYDHLGYSTTEGRFGEWNGKLVVDRENPTNSSVNFVIDIASLDTFYGPRDKHLKGPDFFHAEKYPQAFFQSTKVEKIGDNTFDVIGNLTIKNITKEVTLNVIATPIAEHPMVKKPGAGFRVSTTIKRSDFGMDLYVPYISDEVNVSFNAETVESLETN